ncbi:MAG: hypothetical protein KI786_05715 [Mameliella sp.]|nr:hypothetical protein [Phaeodactylibacter sp.]
MVTRVFESWKTTIVALLIGIAACLSIAYEVASLKEASGFLTTMLLLFFAKDPVKPQPRITFKKPMSNTDYALTPGKGDDILEKVRCVAQAIADAAEKAQTKVIDTDGSFGDFKIKEVDKWAPIAIEALMEVQETAEECFGAEIKNKMIANAFNFIKLLK